MSLAGRRVDPTTWPRGTVVATPPSSTATRPATTIHPGSTGRSTHMGDKGGKKDKDKQKKQKDKKKNEKAKVKKDKQQAKTSPSG